MRETRNAYGVWPENLKGKDYLDDLGVDGRIILKSVLMKNYVKMWTGFIRVHCRPITWVQTVGHSDASSCPCIIDCKSI
jgi:hypothetical protein